MGVFSRVNAIATAAAIACALAAPTAANAWDWPWANWFSDDMAVDSPRADDTPVTFGTGWYLRGDLAPSKDTRLPFGPTSLPQSNAMVNAYSMGLGFGYKFNSFLRADITADYRAPRQFTGNTAIAGCYVGFYQYLDVNNIQHYALRPDSCADFVRARMTNAHLLLNGYVDLGTWYGLTPYVGAGIGVNYIYQKVSRNWFIVQNGQSYNMNINTPDGATYSYYWDQSISSTRLNLALAGMFGASYNITPHTAVDFGYRYLNLGRATVNNVFGSSVGQPTSAHELRIGFRYTPD